MKLKKFFAGVVAAAMMLTMGATAAFAEGGADSKTVAVNNNTVTVQKVYKLEGQGISPEETFNFTISGAEVTNAGSKVDQSNLPVPTIGSAEYDKEGATTDGNTKNVTISFKDAEGNLIYNGVGIYTYQVAETAGKTAGVSYDNKTYTMKVTVVNGATDGSYKIESVSFTDQSGKKDANPSFTNTYTANNLTVSKTVTGALGDKTKKFDFTVTFTKAGNENAPAAITYAYNGNNTVVFADGETTKTVDISLAHGESVIFTNVPKNVQYTVTEKSYAADGYKTYVVNGEEETETLTSEGTMTAAAATSAFKNSKGIDTPDTGVILDNAPYIALLAIVAFGGVALILNKRRRDEE